LLLQGFLVNLALFVFNALPLPGLDGWMVLRSLLFTRAPRAFLGLEDRRLAVYAAVAVLVLALPALTAGTVNPFVAATSDLASALYSHAIQPGVVPLFLGMPNVFAAFST
jgi:Zn-dependent protease